jgi:UDP-N-acetyl-2-amino-2-deoxyglucuronate dehydrogenase
LPAEAPLWVSRGSHAARTGKEMERFGVGIIGAGGIAGAHAKAYSQLAPTVTVVGVADIDEDRVRAFAIRHQIPFWTTEAEDILRHDEIQIVSICTPHHLHAPLAIAALEAGKHVLVEKPLAVSLEEADQMIATAQRTRRLLGTIFQLRYEADTRRARLVLERGLIGAPFYAEVSCLWWRRPVYYEVSWRGRWSTEGGGAVINQAPPLGERTRLLLCFHRGGAGDRCQSDDDSGHAGQYPNVSFPSSLA